MTDPMALVDKRRKGKDWSKRTRPLSREEYRRRIMRGEDIPARLAPRILPMGTYGVQPGENHADYISGIFADGDDEKFVGDCPHSKGKE